MPTMVVLLVDALLSTVSWLDTAPAAFGSKLTSSVSAKVGFKVTGKVAPDIVNPVPLNVAELIVTGAVPVEVSTKGSVDEVFTVTFPKAKLAVLMFNEGTFAWEAFSCIAKVLETPPALAVKVTDCAVVTADTVAVNAALVAFAGTVTVAGTATAALPLPKLTLKPLLPAAVVSVTEQASLPAPVTEGLVQEIALNAAETAEPVPALGVLVTLPFEAPPQPETATTTNAHVDNANSFAHKKSSMRNALRLHGKYERNNVLTSLDAPALPEPKEKHFQ
jgi:hypothetical protein